MPVELIHRIHQCQPWDETLLEPLQGFALRDPKMHGKISLLGCPCPIEKLYPDFFKTLLELISSSHNTDMALHNFERFSEKINDKGYLYTQLIESPALFQALVFCFLVARYSLMYC